MKRSDIHNLGPNLGQELLRRVWLQALDWQNRIKLFNLYTFLFNLFLRPSHDFKAKALAQLRQVGGWWLALVVLLLAPVLVRLLAQVVRLLAPSVVLLLAPVVRLLALTVSGYLPMWSDSLLQVSGPCSARRAPVVLLLGPWSGSLPRRWSGFLRRRWSGTLPRWSVSLLQVSGPLHWVSGPLHWVSGSLCASQYPYCCGLHRMTDIIARSHVRPSSTYVHLQNSSDNTNQSTTRHRKGWSNDGWINVHFITNDRLEK